MGIGQLINLFLVPTPLFNTGVAIAADVGIETEAGQVIQTEAGQDIEQE